MRTGRKNTSKKRTKKIHKKSKNNWFKSQSFFVFNSKNFAAIKILSSIGSPFTKVILLLLSKLHQTTFNFRIKYENLKYKYSSKKKKSSSKNSSNTRSRKKIVNQNTIASKFFKKLLKSKWRQKQIKLALKSLKKKTKPYTIIYQKTVSNFPLLKKDKNKKVEAWILTYYAIYEQHKKSLRKKLRLTVQKLKRVKSTYGKKTKKYTQNKQSDFSRYRKNVIKSFLKRKSQSYKSLVKIQKSWQNKLVASLIWIKAKIASFFGLSIFTKTHELLTHQFSFKLRYLLVLLVIVGSGYGSYYFYQEIMTDLPDPSILSSIKPSLTTKIYDRNGILLYKIFKDENRSLVPLDEIPRHMIQATIAIEDKNFYQHPGFSIRGITRAFHSNLKQESLQGGSTLTQQLVKNTLLTPERTYERKIKELILSFVTEFYYSKDEILSMYLNQVAYGGYSYGVEEASQMYFGKSIREVDVAEAAFLAGLTVAPTTYSPYGSRPEIAKARQLQVLRRMVEDGYIDVKTAEEARKQELVILPPKASILAPHFVMYARDYLAQLYGSQIVEQGGLEVTTSLDLALQNKAQEIVSQEVAGLSSLNVTNGAALITNPKSGEVLAMVGSIDYYDTARDGQVNITIRERQPGSSIKPLTYAMALERGLSPASIIPDTPICYKIQGQDDYCPKNYDGNYHGRVTLRQALANSYNIPAVKLLAQFSVDDLIQKAEAMGISTWTERNRFGLALTLGGGEIKMTDMAVAYGVFANEGMKVPLNPILEVKDEQGNIIGEHPCRKEGSKIVSCEPERVLDPRVAYQISDILSDNQARSQAFGSNSVLHIPGQQVAVKTGTTNDLRDNWTFGYTEDRVVGTWVGNNDNSQMSYVASGITGASPIWNKLIRTQLLADKPHLFQTPTNLVKVNVCSITGQLPCDGCPTSEEYFIPGTEPKQACSSDTIARTLEPNQ